MDFKHIISALFLFLSSSVIGHTQDLKIAYVNIELILLYMPETKTMNQQLATLEKKLTEQLQVKQHYAQSQLQAYQALAQKNPPPTQTVIQAKEKELIKLDEEIKKLQSGAQSKLMTKRQELMEPIVQKMQAGIDTVAEQEGYDLVLNSVDGSGVSIVLYAPDEDDLTERLMKYLGIPIPK